MTGPPRDVPHGTTDSPVFGRDEILQGLSGPRASALVYALERRTAALVHHSRRAMATYQSERSAREDEAAFLGALASGREGHVRPSAQDLERYAPAWADLVPADAQTRAAIAGILGEAYRLPRSSVPAMRSALGLDEAATAEAFRRTHHRPLESIWVQQAGLRERLAWRRAAFARHVESLPPFWMAFALTLTEALGIGVLVAPVALAGLGALGALLLLVVLGIVNLITLGALVESITRHGPMRYGTTYFGRLTGDLLGQTAALVQGVALALLGSAFLVACFLAFGTTLSGATGLPTVAGVALLFGVVLFFLVRESIDATVASALVVGAANLVLLAVLVIVALPLVEADRLATIGDSAGGLDTGALALAFGVVLTAYFGHTSAANVSKAVLRVEGDGRSLLLGNLAALAVVIVMYCVTVVVWVGAIGAEPLVGFDGTVITPLAELVGPVASVVGVVYVTLAIGLAAIYTALGLYNQVKEILPPTSASASRWLERRSVQRALSLAPVVAIFVALEVLVLADAASVSEPLGIVGTLAIPLMGGIFPMLLVLAARRRAERVPGTVLRAIGAIPMVALITVVFVIALVIHGLVIWEDPLARAAALIVAAGMVVLSAWLVARQVFAPRTVVEIRRADGSVAQRVGVVTEGALVASDEAPPGDAVVELHSAEPAEVLVWGHHVTAAGDSLAISGAVSLPDGPDAAPIPLRDGRATVTLRPGQTALRIVLLDEPDTPAAAT